MTLSMSMQGAMTPVAVSVTAPHTGLNADEMADMLTAKLVYVGPDVPAPLRDQAVAYKDRIRTLSRAYIAQAQRSERTTMIGILEQAGEFEAAKLLRSF